MTQLINKLMANAGINAEQAHKSLETVKDYVKEKLPPAFGPQIDALFQGQKMEANGPAPTATSTSSIMDKASDFAANAKDKIQDAAHDAKEKLEDFAGDAKEKLGDFADKAEDAANDAVNKIKDFFNKKD
jgi:hypothetical protein